MTKWDGKLAGVDEKKLRQQLHTETDPKASKRLTSALLYANGVSPAEIERLLGFPDKPSTIGWTPSPSASPPRSATGLIPGAPPDSPTSSRLN